VNRPYLGDNLEWLRDRREFPDARVDLVNPDRWPLFRRAHRAHRAGPAHQERA